MTALATTSTSAMAALATSSLINLPKPAPSHAPSTLTATRSILRTISAKQMREGGGFVVRRPVGSNGLSSESVDPFLMLDHMGPVTYKPGEAVGAPDHPHRGFETVTYLLEGELEHKDSQGNSGILKDGWVQWMTAGSGVVHSEMPSERVLREGGTMEGFQLWVNLPAKDKMCPPRYQDTPPELLPNEHSADGKSWVKVIAGEADINGQTLVSGIETRSPMLMVDIAVQPGGKFTQRIPAGYSGFVYAYRGQGEVGHKTLCIGEAGLLSNSGEALEVEAVTKELRVLVVAGVPLGEPIVQHGPFVMNTQQQILEAFMDYQSGALGEIPGAKERIEQTEQARRVQHDSGTWQADQREL